MQIIMSYVQAHFYWTRSYYYFILKSIWTRFANIFIVYECQEFVANYTLAIWKESNRKFGKTFLYICI